MTGVSSLPHGATEFLAALFADVEGCYVELRGLPSKAQAFCSIGDTDAIAAFAKARRDQESIYFGAAARRSPDSGALENCSALPALFVDIDFKTTDERAARERLAVFPVVPSIVVNSGGGLHVYWLLREPIPLQQDSRGARNLLRRLARALDADIQAAEPARVLRLPNTFNHKYGDKRRVRIERFQPERRYNPSDFDEWLPAEPAPAEASRFTVPATISNGNRNDVLYRTARSLVARGMIESAILAAVRETNAGQCDSPLHDDEVRDIVRKAIQQPDQKGFARQSIAPEDADDGAFPDAWRLLNDVELLALPDPEWLIDSVIQRKSVVVVYAPPAAGKTTLGADLLGSIATGKDWHGHHVQHRGASVYVAAEDPSGFKVRLSGWKRAHGIPLDQVIGVYTFPEPIDLSDPISVGRFQRFLRHTQAAVPLEAVVVDTYASATPGASETSSEDTTLAMAHARQWCAALGVTVILVHHTNASGSRERGHSSMRGAADTMIALTPVDDVVHVECSKQRNGSPFETFTLKLVPVPEGGCVFRPASQVLPSSKMTRTQQKVYDTLQDTFAAHGATKSEWQRACHDIAERSFHRAAKVLLERAFVKQSGTHFLIGRTEGM
jgi:hypothetical protein